MSELRDQPIRLSPAEYIDHRGTLVEATRRARRFLNTQKAGLNFTDGLQGIDPTELLNVGLQTLAVNNVWEGYKLFARRSTQGPTYYDLTLALQHQKTYKTLDLVLQEFEPNVDLGLDIGTGTGEVALRLGRRCRQLIALDYIQPLLAVAHDKLQKADINHYLIEGDLMKMDTLIPPGSIDVAVANAISAYLSYEEHVNFYHQLNRVLKIGGRYYEYNSSQNDFETIIAENYPYPRRWLAVILGAILPRLGLPIKDEDNHKKINLEKYGFSCQGILIDSREAVIQMKKIREIG